jgi:tetratricopeptide (TPR) repeat protein
MGNTYLVNAQEVDENQVAAENMLSMLTSSEAEVTSLFETIVGGGGEVPEDAAEALQEAQEQHIEAQTLYDEGDYEKSLDKATKALNNYGKAITEATPEQPEEPEDPDVTEEPEDPETTDPEDPEDPEEPEVMITEQEEEETEKMIGITTAIEKARKRIEKLQEVSGDLATLEVDTGEASTMLDQATAILDAITLEDPEAAETLLSEANSLIGQATGLLKSNGEPIKEEKIEHFRQQAIHHVEQLKTKMNRFLEKFGSSEETTTLMQSQYGEIMAVLEGIDVTKDGLKDAVTQLKLMEKETRNVGKGTEVEELLGEDGFMSLKGQMKLESKLEYYREIVDSLDPEDPIRVEAEPLLALVEELIDGAETALVGGNEDQADEMEEDAEVLLDEVEGLLGDLVKGNGNGVKPDKEVKDAKLNGKGHNKEEEPPIETSEDPDPEDPEDPEEPEDPDTNTP